MSTTFEIGVNCHVILTHADVNEGEPYGFLCQEDSGVFPGGVKITHEVDSDGNTRLYVYFDVLLSDHSIDPNGSAHAFTRAQDYALLVQYLQQVNSISLDTPVGTFLNLGAIGWTADERHLPLSSIVKCQINNAGIYWPPVDADVLALCYWGSSLTWNTGYWQ